jgi:hypothetical protein
MARISGSICSVDTIAHVYSDGARQLGINSKQNDKRMHKKNKKKTQRNHNLPE